MKVYVNDYVMFVDKVHGRFYGKVIATKDNSALIEVGRYSPMTIALDCVVKVFKKGGK